MDDSTVQDSSRNSTNVNINSSDTVIHGGEVVSSVDSSAAQTTRTASIINVRLDNRQVEVSHPHDLLFNLTVNSFPLHYIKDVAGAGAPI